MASSGLVYDHAGQGGKPLLLLHGWPETRRIWERNVEPLAAEITGLAAESLGVAPGMRVTAAWKASATRLVRL